MSSNEEEQVNLFLEAIKDHFQHLDPRTNWPLNAAQMNTYFDFDEANEIYSRINQLKNKLTIKEIAELMPPVDMLRLALTHNLIIGLKVGDKLKKTNFGSKERTEYFLFLTQIMKELTKGDIFCLDGANRIFSESEINTQIQNVEFSVPNSEIEKKSMANFLVTMNHYAYSLFYDVYMSAGFFIHGPYNVSEKFGKNTILVVREYHNLKPGIWPNENSPFKKMKMFLVYKNLNYKIDFENSQQVNDSIPDKLVAFAVYADGKLLPKEEMLKLEEFYDDLSIKQAKYVDSLAEFEKVKHAALICHSFFNKLRENTPGESFLPSVDKNIAQFGDKFIVENKREIKPDVSHWMKLFDPRNEYIEFES